MTKRGWYRNRTEEQKARYRASARRWKLRNPDKVKAHKKKDYQKRKAVIRKKCDEWHAANRERAATSRKAWLAKNKARMRARLLERKASDPQFFKDRNRRYAKKFRVAHWVARTRSFCQRNGLEHDLTAEWVRQRIGAGICEMSGLPLDLDGKRTPLSPSIDRIDPKGPYTQANCRIIIWWLNRALLNLGEDFATDVFERVIARRKPKLALVA